MAVSVCLCCCTSQAYSTDVVSVANRLGAIERIVVLMMASRSFDHMLGFLYPGNVSPSGQPFEGLAGTETNFDSSGQPVTVFRIEPTSPARTSCLALPPAKGTSRPIASSTATTAAQRLRGRQRRVRASCRTTPTP